MAMSVTVLCPNGRRAVVKVTPNTSILQIIEDACKKEKFDPDEYDLKHLNRNLDSSSTIRYTNLPNKCQLELVKSAIPRKSSVVTVNIASESGTRLVHEFLPDTTLWEILTHYEQQQGNTGVFIPGEEDEREPVIVYMMRRVSGPDLRTTTLKSLGLTRGKCMLRHSFQLSGAPQQAHVSAPLSRPKLPKTDAQIPEVPKNNTIQMSSRVDTQVPQPSSYRTEEEEPSVAQKEADEPTKEPSVSHKETKKLAEEPVSKTVTPSIFSKDHTLLGTPHVLSSAGKSCSDVQTHNGELKSDASQSPHHVPMDVDEECNSAVKENVIKLGARDAFLFNIDDAPPTDFAVDDEAFFDLTVDEVKGLYREQQNVLRSFEDAPLMTKQMRDMHETSKVLCALNQFPVTQLRIYFPDSNVIQAAFKPIETIAEVMDFVRKFLNDSSIDFTLSMRHPQRTLSPEVTLVSADCVPNARLYFTSSSSSPYLNEETLNKKSSFSSSCSATKSRKIRKTMPSYTLDETEPGCSSQKSTATEVCNSEAGYQKRTSTSTPATGAVKKVPKWFKTGK